MPLTLGRVYAVTVTTLGALGVVLWFAIGPWPHDSWLRSPRANEQHALDLLPVASMLQAAAACPGGHFGPDETYGYWVQDFQHVLRSPGRRSAFATLVLRPETMARLYGLIGLRLTHPEMAATMEKGVEWPDTTVLVSDSCSVEHRSLRVVVNEILSGSWDSRLVRVPVDVH